MHFTRLFGAALFTCLALPAFAQSGEVNVYSYREPGLIQPLLDRFTAETGIKTNVLFAGDGLIERVQAEAEFSPADMAGLVIAQTVTQLAVGVLAEASLSYVGLGVQSPATSLGLMLRDAQTYALLKPTLALIPGLTIVLIVVALNLTADGLRAELDPGLRRLGGLRGTA